MKWNYLKTYLQLLVALVLWVIVVIEHGLTRCLTRLGNPMLGRQAMSVLGKVIDKRESQADVRSDLGVCWDWLKNQDAAFIAERRCEIEAFCGVPISARRNDPHLYALRFPTKQENLRRIAYVFQALPSWQLREWVVEVADALR